MCLLFLLCQVLSLCPCQPHSEEEDGEEERGEGDALPAQGGRRRAGARRAGVQPEGTSALAYFLLFIQEGGARPGLKARLPLQLERKQLTVCARVHVRVFFLHRNNWRTI